MFMLGKPTVQPIIDCVFSLFREPVGDMDFCEKEILRTTTTSGYIGFCREIIVQTHPPDCFAAAGSGGVLERSNCVLHPMHYSMVWENFNTTGMGILSLQEQRKCMLFFCCCIFHKLLIVLVRVVLIPPSALWGRRMLQSFVYVSYNLCSFHPLHA